MVQYILNGLVPEKSQKIPKFNCENCCKDFF